MSDVKLTWYGTNAWKLQTPESTLLIDPFTGLADADHIVPTVDFLGADAVLITHGHFDHLSSVPVIMAKEPTLVFCTEIGRQTLGQQLEEVSEDYKDLLENVIEIAPLNTFEPVPGVSVEVSQGKHIHFDAALVAKTLDPRHLARDAKNVLPLIELIAQYPENHETVVYDIEAEGKHLQFLGSLALHEDVEYRTGADYLVLPYQGRTDLPEQARNIIARLQPKEVIASHFNDSFPPLSSDVDIAELREMMANYYPDIPLIIPEFETPIEL